MRKGVRNEQGKREKKRGGGSRRGNTRKEGKKKQGNIDQSNANELICRSQWEEKEEDDSKTADQNVKKDTGEKTDGDRRGKIGSGARDIRG